MQNALVRMAVECCWIVFVLAGVATAQQTREATEAMQSDAQLADIAFVDARRGWAVGDRGVIWHTDDGGRHWTLQPSGVDCRLASVFFLDDKLGWAAGGYTQPYTHTTVGVVLHTRDGGATWSVRRDRILPAVRRIGFFDHQHGWAVGRSSALFPAGAFTTDDGGRSWRAMPGTSTQNWLTADLIDPNTGAAAGRDGLFATIRRRGIDVQPTDFGLRALHRMQLVDATHGWLVGDGGLILQTTDLGKSWQTSAGPLPPGGSTQFDYQALAVRGEHVWVAGTPGTRVFHTADGGQNWEALNTGYATPLRALAFVDQQQGWAVGDLGQILATADGGRTWRKQRAGGERGALVGFFSRPDEIPLELLAKLSADDGYLGVMEILNRENAEIRSTVDPGDLAQEATVAAGASVGTAAWRFPLRSAELKLSADQLLEDWNRVNDGEALEKIEGYVVGRIRMWRPSVVVTVGADARDPLALAVNQIVLRAAEYAADPTRFPEQIAEAGLQPWSVRKVYAALDDGVGTSNINTAQVTARLGRSIGELAAPARGLVAPQYVTPAANIGFRLLVDHVPQGVGERDFFSGIPLAPGGDARRAYVETSQNNLAAAQREAQRYRNLQAILDRADKDQADGHFLANIGDQTADLAPDRAAEVLFQLAKRYWIKGQPDMAAECFDVIAERHRAHPLAGAALVWLVEYYASSEVAHRDRGTGKFSVRQVSAQAVASPEGAAEGLPAGGVGASLRKTSDATLAVRVLPDGQKASDAEHSLDRAARATGYMKQLEQVEPAVAFEPHVRFALAVAEQAPRALRPGDAILSGTQAKPAGRRLAGLCRERVVALRP